MRPGLVEVGPVVERFARLNGVEKITFRIDVSSVGGPREFLAGSHGNHAIASDELILKAAETDEELKRLIVMWELSDG